MGSVFFLWLFLLCSPHPDESATPFESYANPFKRKMSLPSVHRIFAADECINFKMENIKKIGPLQVKRYKCTLYTREVDQDSWLLQFFFYIFYQKVKNKVTNIKFSMAINIHFFSFHKIMTIFCPNFAFTIFFFYFFIIPNCVYMECHCVSTT